VCQFVVVIPFYATRGTLRAARGTLRATRGTLRAARGTLRVTRGTLRAARGTLRAARGTLRAARGTLRDKYSVFIPKECVICKTGVFKIANRPLACPEHNHKPHPKNIA
jgi:hypothetical protein